jgi:hypothetical protein
MFPTVYLEESFMKRLALKALPAPCGGRLQIPIRIAGEVGINRFNNSRDIEVRRLDIVK